MDRKYQFKKLKQHYLITDVTKSEKKIVQVPNSIASAGKYCDLEFYLFIINCIYLKSFFILVFWPNIDATTVF